MSTSTVSLADTTDRVLKQLAAVEAEHLKRKQQQQQQNASGNNEQQQNHVLQLNHTDSAAIVAISRWCDSGISQVTHAIGFAPPRQTTTRTQHLASSSGGGHHVPSSILSPSRQNQQHPSLYQPAQIASAFSAIRMELFRLHSATSYRLGVQVAAAHAVTSWVIAELRVLWTVFVLPVIESMKQGQHQDEEGETIDKQTRDAILSISGVLTDFARWYDRIVSAGPSIFDLSVVESACEAKRAVLSTCIAEWIAQSLRGYGGGSCKKNDNIVRLWSGKLGPSIAATLITFSTEPRDKKSSGTSSASSANDITMTGYSLSVRDTAVLICERGAGKAVLEWECAIQKGLAKLVDPSKQEESGNKQTLKTLLAAKPSNAIEDSRAIKPSALFGSPLFRVSLSGASTATELTEVVLQTLQRLFTLGRRAVDERRRSGGKTSGSNSNNSNDALVQRALDALTGGSGNNSSSFVCNDGETFFVRSLLASLAALCDSSLMLRDDALGSAVLTASHFTGQATTSPSSSPAATLRSAIWKTVSLLSSMQHCFSNSSSSSSTTSSSRRNNNNNASGAGATTTSALTLPDEADQLLRTVSINSNNENTKNPSKKNVNNINLASVIVALRSLYRGENFAATLLGIDSSESHHLTSRPEHGAALSQVSSLDTIVPGELDLALAVQRISCALATIPTGTVKAVDVLRRMLVRRQGTGGASSVSTISLAQLDSSASLDEGSADGRAVSVSFSTPYAGGRLLDWVTVVVPSRALINAVLETVGCVVPATAEARPTLLRQAISLLVSPAVPTEVLAEFLTRMQHHHQHQLGMQAAKLSSNNNHQQAATNSISYQQQGEFRAFVLHVISSAVQGYSLARLRRAIDPLILKVGFQFLSSAASIIPSASSSASHHQQHAGQQQQQHSSYQQSETLLAHIVREFSTSESGIARISAEQVILALERRVSDVRPVDRDLGALLLRCARQALMHQATIIRIMKALPETPQLVRVIESFTRRSHEVCVRLFRCLSNRFEDVLVTSEAHIMLTSLQLLDLCSAADASGVSASGAPATVRNLTVSSSSSSGGATQQNQQQSNQHQHEDDLADRDAKSTHAAAAAALRAIKFSVKVIESCSNNNSRGSNDNKQLVPVKFVLSLDNVPVKLNAPQLLTVEVWGPRENQLPEPENEKKKQQSNSNKKPAASNTPTSSTTAEPRRLLEAYSLLLPEYSATQHLDFNFSCQLHVPRNRAAVSPFQPYEDVVGNVSEAELAMLTAIRSAAASSTGRGGGVTAPAKDTAIGKTPAAKNDDDDEDADEERAEGGDDDDDENAETQLSATAKSASSPVATHARGTSAAADVYSPVVSGGDFVMQGKQKEKEQQHQQAQPHRVCDAPLIVIRLAVAAASAGRSGGASTSSSGGAGGSVVPPPIAALPLLVPSTLAWSECLEKGGVIFDTNNDGRRKVFSSAVVFSNHEAREAVVSRLLDGFKQQQQTNKSNADEYIFVSRARFPPIAVSITRENSDEPVLQLRCVVTDPLLLAPAATAAASAADDDVATADECDTMILGAMDAVETALLSQTDK